MAVQDDVLPIDDVDLREEAMKRLRKKEDFRAHLLVYALFNGLVWIVWALTTPDGFPWPALMTGAWGIGVVMNARDIYGRRPVTEAQLRHEIERLRRT